jgi:predicted nicotinamide N-methyase
VWCGVVQIVVASDVIYNENVVPELLQTLRELTGPNSTVLLSGELRNGNPMDHLFSWA